MTQTAFSFFALCRLADGSRGGALEVRDFKKRAKEGESCLLVLLLLHLYSGDHRISTQKPNFWGHISVHVKTQQGPKQF